MLTFVTIDDVPENNQVLKEMLDAVCRPIELEHQFGLMTTDPKEFESYAVTRATGTDTTVYFMDIELGAALNGVELCQRLHDIDPRGYIVYVSAYQQYALKCCQSHAFDFLLKPFSMEELSACIKAIAQDAKNRVTGPTLSLSIGSQTLYVPQKDILYFKKEQLYMRVETVDNAYTWRCNFPELEPKLESALFVQTHRSFLVNRAHVRKADWDERTLTMDDGSVIPIARRLVEPVKQALTLLEKEAAQ